MSRWIIASAAYFESEPLVNRLREQGFDVTQLITGVGLTESSIVSARLRDLVMDRDIIFCCTGGILGNFNDITAYQARTVELRPQDVRSGQSYLLNDFEPTITLPGLPLGLPFCAALGSVGISTVAATHIKNPPELETLELYGIARAWAPVARTLTAVVVSTNATGKDAHRDWKMNFRQAANLTAECISAGLQKINRK